MMARYALFLDAVWHSHLSTCTKPSKIACGKAEEGTGAKLDIRRGSPTAMVMQKRTGGMLPNQDSMPGMAFMVLQTACPKAVPAKKVGKMKPPRKPAMNEVAVVRPSHTKKQINPCHDGKLCQLYRNVHPQVRHLKMVQIAAKC